MDAGVAEVFQGEQTGDIWEWTGAAYQAAVVIVPGKGYWVYRAGSSVVVTVRGTFVAIPDVSLTAGWNLVGPVSDAPYEPVPLPLTTVPVGAVNYPMYSYDAATGTTQFVGLELEVGLGYWLFLNVDADVDLAS